MKKVALIFVFISSLFIGSCNSEKNNSSNTTNEEQQTIQTMKLGLDTNNAEIIMERDTTD